MSYIHFLILKLNHKSSKAVTPWIYQIETHTSAQLGYHWFVNNRINGKSIFSKTINKFGSKLIVL